MAKHTIMIGGDDGKVYKISSDELQRYEVSQDEPHIPKLRSKFDAGLTHLVEQPGSVKPGVDPPNCFAATSAGEYVHFLNLSTSADADTD